MLFIVGSLYLAVFGVVSWWIFVAVVSVIVLAGWVAFPLLTSYDRLTEGPQCLRCGYDLKGVESALCPECGHEHDAKTAAI
mgnify:CR=1 FL=1